MNEKDSRYNRIMHNIRRSAGYNWDNSILRVGSIYGRSYSFMVACNWEYQAGKKIRPNSWSVDLWDESGQVALTTMNFPVSDYKTDCLTNAQVDELMKHAHKHLVGIVRCTGCGDEVHTHSKKNYGGRYFAGTYCTKCWEGGVKQKAAAENYN